MAVRPHSSPCPPASAPCPTGTPRLAPQQPPLGTDTRTLGVGWPRRQRQREPPSAVLTYGLPGICRPRAWPGPGQASCPASAGAATPEKQPHLLSALRSPPGAGLRCARGLGCLGGLGGGDSPDPAHGTCLSGALLKPRLPSPSQEDVAKGILPGRSWGLSLSAFLPFPHEAFAEGRGSPGDSGTSGGLLAQEPSFGWRMGRRSGNLGCLKLVLCLPSP